MKTLLIWGWAHWFCWRYRKFFFLLSFSMLSCLTAWLRRMLVFFFVFFLFWSVWMFSCPSVYWRDRLFGWGDRTACSFGTEDRPVDRCASLCGSQQLCGGRLGGPWQPSNSGWACLGGLQQLCDSRLGGSWQPSNGGWACLGGLQPSNGG